jgi:hypothetical protein
LNFFDDLRNKIEKGVAETGLASKRMMELGKLTYKIKEKKTEAESIAAKIGWITYSHWRKENAVPLDDEITPILRQLQVLDKEIKELETDLANIKFGNKEQTSYSSETPVESPVSSSAAMAPLLIYLCPYCAHQVGEDDRQCGHCQKRYY